MPESYYQSGEHRAERVHQLFSRIAGRYDRLNDLQSLWLHRCWKRRLIALADPRPGEAGLDVCCGTGDPTLKPAGRGACAMGLDFSEAMLQVAQARSMEQRGIGWVQGDASRLPFPTE